MCDTGDELLFEIFSSASTSSCALQLGHLAAQLNRARLASAGAKTRLWKTTQERDESSNRWKHPDYSDLNASLLTCLNFRLNARAHFYK